MVDFDIEQDKIFNVANGLSVLRMILAPVFMILVFANFFKSAFIVILIASLTDFLDGKIARAYKIQTRLGKMLDPLADKIIVFFAVITLVIKLKFPLWLALLIIGRDVILLAGSSVYLLRNKQKVLRPNLLGKITMFIQLTMIVAFSLAQIFELDHMLQVILITITAIFTIASGLVYIWKGYELFFGSREKTSPKINLPNKLTLIRVIFIPVFIAFLLSNLHYKKLVAAIIFIGLAITDCLDGYLARKRNQITNFGTLVDPLADKLLVSSALIFLIKEGVDPWMAYTIIAREFIVTGLRTLAMARNYVLPSRMSGKIKTVMQVVAITAVLLEVPYAYSLMVIAVLITVYSGIEYIWQSRHMFKELYLH